MLKNHSKTTKSLNIGPNLCRSNINEFLERYIDKETKYRGTNQLTTKTSKGEEIKLIEFALFIYKYLQGLLKDALVYISRPNAGDAKRENENSAESVAVRLHHRTKMWPESPDPTIHVYFYGKFSDFEIEVTEMVN